MTRADNEGLRMSDESTPMTTALSTAACAAALALMAATGAAAAADTPCDKNHYILNLPVDCGWVLVGDLNAARAGHTATLLQDGRVLVAGGVLPPRSSSERHDWYLQVASPDGAELYDSRTGEWSRAAPLSTNRIGHTATLLADGRVLVVGGETSYHYALFRNGTAEIFDPATGAWTPTGSMISTRWPTTATATLLPSGKVLVAGGWAMDAYPFGGELYDPRTGEWTAVGELVTGRYQHTASGLANGKVLLASGVVDDMTGTTGSAAELYDPATGSWTPTGNARFSRAAHASTVLLDGRVLVSGGYSMEPAPPGGYYSVGSLGSSEIYDPDSGQWTTVPDLEAMRFQHTATLLSDGAVLTVGGRAPLGDTHRISLASYFRLTYSTLDSVELRPGGAQRSVAIGSLNEARFGHTATLLPDGSVLVVGGLGGDGFGLSSTEVYRRPVAPSVP